MSNVKVNYVGSPHYMAFCSDCDWVFADHRDTRKVQREIRKHVSSSRHTIHLEKAVVTIYSPKETS